MSVEAPAEIIEALLRWFRLTRGSFAHSANYNTQVSE